LLTVQRADELLRTVPDAARWGPKVAEFTEVIREDGWRPGSIIEVSAEGRLRDGVCRCAAVIAAGRPIWVKVVHSADN
jgi:hypothetical protein